MRLLQLITIMILCTGIAQAQDMSLESLKAMKAEKEAAAAALDSEVADLQAKIDTYPGWKFGGFGAIGFDGIRNNNWFAISNPQSQQGNLNLGFGGSARLDREKYYWDNTLGIKLARTGAFADKDVEGTKSIALTNNALNLISGFGYKLAPKWAVSVGLNWLSTVLERETDIKYNLAFNAPGSATLSAGITWLPIQNLKVDIHPLGYQKNWPGDLSSLAGAKIGATYFADILPNVTWNSSLLAFIPYTNPSVDTPNSYAYTDASGVEQSISRSYETSDLTNWTWINTFTTNIWKGIGVVAEFGLAQNRQQADLTRIANSIDGAIEDDSPFQSYYSIGLGYTFK